MQFSLQWFPLKKSTHLPIIVQVGVEAYSAMTCGLQVDQHGGLGIVVREKHIKLKTAISIRSVRWSSDKNLHKTGASKVKL